MGEIIKMGMSGILFGFWPLLMNKSGLPGFTAALVYSIISLLFVLPVSLITGVTTTGVDWRFAVAGACCGGLGLLFFTNGLAEATPLTVGRLFVLMTVVQITVPVAYHALMNGGVAFKTGCGFATAILTALLLV